MSAALHRVTSPESFAMNPVAIIASGNPCSGDCANFTIGAYLSDNTIATICYVNISGSIHSNTIEGFFSLVKRGLYGTFHSVSRHHLHRYLDEFCYRYNTRKISDGERAGLLVAGDEGKRLTYKQPATS